MGRLRTRARLLGVCSIGRSAWRRGSPENLWLVGLASTRGDV